MTSEAFMDYLRVKHIRIDCHSAEDLRILKTYLRSVDLSMEVSLLCESDLSQFPYAGPTDYNQYKWALWRIPDTVTWSVERALQEFTPVTEADEEIQRPNLEDVL